MKLLNIYGQPFEHAEAIIKGNREGLVELRDAIDRALRNGKAETAHPHDCIFASDGEGYHIIIERHDGVWGQDKDGSYNTRRFWNKVHPEYTSYLEIPHSP